MRVVVRKGLGTARTSEAPRLALTSTSVMPVAPSRGAALTAPARPGARRAAPIVPTAHILSLGEAESGHALDHEQRQLLQRIHTFGVAKDEGLSSSVAGARKLTLNPAADGTQHIAVIKKRPYLNYYGPSSDLASYMIDRMYGFNLVPPTAPYMDDGGRGRVGATAQEWAHGKEPHEAHLDAIRHLIRNDPGMVGAREPSQPNENLSDLFAPRIHSLLAEDPRYEEDAAKLGVFDTIRHDWDRHSHNYQHGSDGRLIAFDNNMGFMDHGKERELNGPAAYFPLTHRLRAPPSLHERLLDVPYERLRSDLRGYIHPGKLAETYLRARALGNILRDQDGKIGLEELHSAWGQHQRDSRWLARDGNEWNRITDDVNSPRWEKMV